MLTLDFVAKRYGMLPSRLLVEGVSIDVYIADLAVSYENHLYKRQQTGATSDKPVPTMTQEQMQAMIDRAKNSKKEKL